MLMTMVQTAGQGMTRAERIVRSVMYGGGLGLGLVAVLAALARWENNTDALNSAACALPLALMYLFWKQLEPPNA
jgi:hypothetical protein